MKSMLDAGVKVVFEMDRDDYVWHDLEIFVTRTDNEGNVWGAHEAVDRVTALKMITSWAAEYVLRETSWALSSRASWLTWRCSTGIT